jgi:hypothetical protein
MNASIPSPVAKPPISTWKWIFRIVRWTTYAAALITLLMVLHKAPPPRVETSPQAAARAEEKIQQVEKAVASGAPATLRMDETELNSYLASHLELSPAPAKSPSPGSEPTVEEMRSNVRDFKVELVGDRVRAYIVFDLHGKDMSLQLEGMLRAADGYLQFVPTAGSFGSLPIPQSALESAVRRLMDSPENREKLRLPADISDLRIENGEIVVSYK